ncbi:MAG: hypothetical protein ACQEVD_16165 [Actinomycetota bacterium]
MDPIQRDLELLGELPTEDEAKYITYMHGMKIAEERGYRNGHRQGHREGWDAALARVKANEAQFIRGIVDELRRRELEDEHLDTSASHKWIADLIESLETKARRDQWDAQVRRERAERLEKGTAA